MAAANDRLCFLTRTIESLEWCACERCPFWLRASPTHLAGCLLERLAPEEDWSPELAARWRRIRDRARPAAAP